MSPRPRAAPAPSAGGPDRTRASSTPTALAFVPQPLPSIRLLRAEGRVRGLLAEVLRLDSEREALERELSAFSAAWEREAGTVLAELEGAERVVRRMRRIEEELRRALDAERKDGRSSVEGPDEGERSAGGRDGPGSHRAPVGASPARRAATPRGGIAPSAASDSDDALDADVVVEPEELALKRLHRHLARSVHPDVARDDAERARFQDWMSRVNAAYHHGDLAALEILAEKIGVGEAPGEPSERERLARLERRAVALDRALRAVERDLTRLRTSEAFRLRGEWQEHAGRGADLAEETRQSSTARIERARREALARFGACVDAAATLEAVVRDRARRTEAARAAAAPARRPRRSRRDPAEGGRPSPLERSPLARAGVSLAEIGRPGPRALELARELADLASLPGPWEPALALLAFFAEVGGRIPESLARPEGLAQRWDALRSGWPVAPELPRALARLPRHLELGLRHRGASVEFAVQLTTPDMLAGVRHALASGALQSLARDVLGVLGPLERCDACEASVFAIHLLRTRGLDEVHGLVCRRCGGVLRSFWHYGDAEGLEALGPLATEVGLVSEAHVLMGRRTVAFQMLPEQRAALTAEGLGALLHALYVQPHGAPLQRHHLAFALESSRTPLAPDASIPPGRRVRLHLAGAAMRERAVVSWIAERIQRRFRR